MVHECRMQGAGSPSYYDRVPKLKQSMCGGIGRRNAKQMGIAHCEYVDVHFSERHQW